ncbi:Nucleoside-diphosphate-sugar epimerase [Clostridium cavendishii DSM 21758]|uniref:Nucleoside-diphosphate-sugar epimerase n=1 Tax=Clostridium cavendishii DSM 21758 TaxID=1121302 RepID=A0A1M6AWC8_9CLOT|nr:SDR family NAD(P)-dependent oxidoreductase [Clostridium cavendishii]SHI40747.1 Nucleoside-diphosphate-sugar epimerase [Clostridium cavendishii DSM 21758]
MKILVTGGAGFIGRWVVKKLLEENHIVIALDNLSNGSLKNIEEFKNNSNFTFIKGDIQNERFLDNIFREKFDIIYHLAASINVQDSIDDPRTTFYNDTVGTFNILERAKWQMFGKSSKMDGEQWVIEKREQTHPCKFVFMSTCMVFDKCDKESGIDELHPTKPVSPYGASKIAAENLVVAYYLSYKLPTVVIRPFNTYGPHQKSGGEGGVVAIFIKNALDNRDINIYGTGDQTRDLLYVKDCARFVVMAGFESRIDGEIVNAGTGRDVTINELAEIIGKGRVKINHVKHIHPQAEIMKLKCNSSKANAILGWTTEYTLEDGIKETEEWINNKF